MKNKLVGLGLYYIGILLAAVKIKKESLAL